jgi:hypothetical protein
MIPKTSLFGWLTREGRLKNQWARALADQNPAHALEKLRKVRRKLRKDPAVYSHLWMPFINTYIDKNRLPLLKDSDLDALEEMGEALLHTSTPLLRPHEVWLRVIAAYDVRKEERKARALLTRICKTPYSPTAVRETCIRSLARRKARGDEHVGFYIKHLRSVSKPAGETDVLRILTDICAVSFDSQQPTLKRAGEVAARLADSNIKVPRLDTALGLYFLLIEQSPPDAVRHFTIAHQENTQNTEALIGLLSALVRNAGYKKVAEIAETFDRVTDPTVTGLIDLSTTLQWLENHEIPGPPPVTAGTLKDANLGRYAGDTAAATLGRLYLIEGNAQRAKQILVPLAKKYPDKPKIAYYAAWAASLTGDRENVVLCFNLMKNWRGRWTAACLLMDIDPALAKKNRVSSHLDMVPKKFAKPVKARVAMAQLTLPPAIKWKPGSGTLEEDLEALRIFLGYTFYTNNKTDMERTMDVPLFHRLPLADRVMWKGLYALLSGDRLQGRVLLEESAVKLGCRRAAFVLSMFLMEQEHLTEAVRFLDQAAAGRKDEKIELLQAYVDASEGRIETAAARLEKLLAKVEARAQYASGNLYLFQAEKERESGRSKRVQFYREQAVGAFHAAAKVKNQSLPEEFNAFAQCAEFFVNPGKIVDASPVTWDELEKLNASRIRPWVVWNIVIDRIRSGNPAEVVSASEKIIDLLEQVENAGDTLLEAVARAAAQACVKASNIEASSALVKVLERISTDSENQVVKHLYRLAFTAAVRLRCSNDGTTKSQVCRQLERVAKIDRGNGSLSLLKAQAHLENSGKEEAAAVLRNTGPENDFEKSLCTCLADLLEERIVPEENLPRPGIGAAPGIIQGCNLLRAAAAFPAGAPEKGYDAILSTMGLEPQDITGIVDFNKFLPALCAYSSRRSTPPPSLIEAIRSLSMTDTVDENNITTARCAAAIGENEYACRIWENILKKDTAPENPIRREFVRFLCYLAVKDFIDKNTLKAAEKLRLASNVSKGGIHHV